MSGVPPNFGPGLTIMSSWPCRESGRHERRPGRAPAFRFAVVIGGSAGDAASAVQVMLKDELRAVVRAGVLLDIGGAGRNWGGAGWVRGPGLDGLHVLPRPVVRSAATAVRHGGAGTEGQSGESRQHQGC